MRGLVEGGGKGGSEGGNSTWEGRVGGVGTHTKRRNIFIHIYQKVIFLHSFILFPLFCLSLPLLIKVDGRANDDKLRHFEP